MVALSLPAFFARTPEDLLAFNEARRIDPSTRQPDLARVGAYLAAHPEAMTAVNAALTHPIPASYTSLTYHSLHAYRFEAADDRRSPRPLPPRSPRLRRPTSTTTRPPAVRPTTSATN